MNKFTESRVVKKILNSPVNEMDEFTYKVDMYKELQKFALSDSEYEDSIYDEDNDLICRGFSDVNLATKYNSEEDEMNKQTAKAELQSISKEQLRPTSDMLMEFIRDNNFEAFKELFEKNNIDTYALLYESVKLSNVDITKYLADKTTIIEFSIVNLALEISNEEITSIILK
jgi:hypothetical protein